MQLKGFGISNLEVGLQVLDGFGQKMWSAGIDLCKL